MNRLESPSLTIPTPGEMAQRLGKSVPVEKEAQRAHLELSPDSSRLSAAEQATIDQIEARFKIPTPKELADRLGKSGPNGGIVDSDSLGDDFESDEYDHYDPREYFDDEPTSSELLAQQLTLLLGRSRQRGRKFDSNIDGIGDDEDTSDAHVGGFNIRRRP